MAATLAIVPTEQDHIEPIAANLRQADRDELEVGSGRSPFEALEFSLSKSSISRTILIDGVPAGMFGCGDLNILLGIGCPWLLGTDDLALAPLAFLRASLAWRDQLLSRYAVLRNLVDARNTGSIRWLGWLGFQISEPIPVGRDKKPLRLFEMRADNV